MTRAKQFHPFYRQTSQNIRLTGPGSERERAEVHLNEEEMVSTEPRNTPDRHQQRGLTVTI